MNVIHEGSLGVRRVDCANSLATLVWIHGLGESGLGFEAMMRHPRLAAFSHRAPDLPGYGRSAWRDHAVGLEEHVDAVRRDLEAVSGKVVLIGHSMGGVIGQWLVAREPRRFAAFLNVEGNISPDDCTSSARIAAREVKEFADGGVDELLAAIYRAGATDASMAGYYASLRFSDPRTLHLNSEELVRWSREEGLATQLGALSLPQIYLLGDPRGTGARSRSLLDAAGVPWRAIDDAGHWPFLDQPERFVDEVLAFLAPLEL